MNRRNMLNCGICTLVTLAIVSGYAALHQRPSTITRENCRLIQSGMTVAEVEAILGGPARDEVAGRLTMMMYRPLLVVSGDGRSHAEWVGTYFAIIVVFKDGRVFATSQACVTTVRPYLVDMALYWLGM